jgi:hypothetical protein
MKSRVLWVAALSGAFAVCMNEVRAQEPTTESTPESSSDALPAPPDGWWEQVQAGDYATYEMSQMGMQFTMKLQVDAREGSSITFTTTMEMVGGPQGGMPPQTQTIDFGDPAQLTANTKLPKGSTVKKVGEETITAAGREWSCAVYEVEGMERGQKVKMKLWHNPELLPVFSNGSVKMEVEIMGPNGQPMKIDVLLTGLGKASEGGEAPAPNGGGGTQTTPGKG